MAYLPELPEWTDGVYQLEKSDPVRGGVDGPANRPLIDLLKRTAWLKQRYEEAFSGLGWAELGEWAVGLEVKTPSQIVHYQGYWYRYGGSLPHTITGASPSLDDNDNWFNLGNDVSLRANLGSSELPGASLVSLPYGTVADAIHYVTPEMFGTIQGAIDSLSGGGVVYLAPETYTESFTVKSGVRVVGAGQPVYLKENDSWSAGTLIRGSVTCSGAIGFTLQCLGIDAYSGGGNAISGLTPDTGYGLIDRVSTRANNHGQLWEANDDNRSNTNAIGHILVRDCKHYGGPNGFVTKHKAVTFLRCETFDVSIQGYVVVSDNINGSEKYSRATKTVIQDCWHNNDRTVNASNEGIRIYSRDYNKDNLTVLGAYDTRIINFNGTGCAGGIIRSGENAADPTAYAKVQSLDTLILDMPYNVAPFGCLQFDSMNRLHFDNCIWGNQVNVDLKNDSCQQVTFGPNNRAVAGATLLGVESGILTVTTNAASITPRAGQRVIKIQNTAATTVTGIGFGSVGKEHIIQLLDNVTTLNLGVPYKGYGIVIHVRYNGASWDVLSADRRNTSLEFDRSAQVSGGVFDMLVTSAGLMNQYINITSALTSVTHSDAASYLVAGDEVRLRIRNGNGSASVTVGGWSGFKNLSTLTLAPTEKALIRFVFDGDSLVATSVIQYT